MQNNEKQDSQDQLKRIGQEFLDVESSDSKELHIALQNQIREIYESVKKDIDFTDAQTINDSIAEIASDSPNTPSIAAWLPKEYNKYEGTNMECTLGSAMVKLALEESGFGDIRTAILKGHQVAVRNNENGGITILDPTTTHTAEGERHGFSADFKEDQIVNKRDVYDNQGNLRGQRFRIETREKPSYTGMFANFDEERAVYYQDFFASEPNTLVELSVILENLGDLSNEFNAKQITEDLGMFNHKDLFR